MSSKFLDRLDEIREGTPASMGFGPARSQKTPGMALVLLVSSKHKAGATTAGGLSPDAVIISGIGTPDKVGELKETLADLTWGVRADALSSEDAQSYRDSGCDLLAFQLQGTALGAIYSEDSMRVLCVDPNTAAEDLRDINALPVDAVMVPLPGASADWTLEDLSRVAKVSGKMGKYVLAEIADAPDAEALKVLRAAGIIGLVLDVSAGTAAIKRLRTALMDMPRSGSNRTGRSSAILPGAVYAAAGPPASEPDEPDEDE